MVSQYSIGFRSYEGNVLHKCVAQVLLEDPKMVSDCITHLGCISLLFETKKSCGEVWGCGELQAICGNELPSSISTGHLLGNSRSRGCESETDLALLSEFLSKKCFD